MFKNFLSIFLVLSLAVTQIFPIYAFKNEDSTPILEESFNMIPIIVNPKSSNFEVNYVNRISNETNLNSTINKTKFTKNIITNKLGRSKVSKSTYSNVKSKDVDIVSSKTLINSVEYKEIQLAEYSINNY